MLLKLNNSEVEIFVIKNAEGLDQIDITIHKLQNKELNEVLLFIKNNALIPFNYLYNDFNNQFIIKTVSAVFESKFQNEIIEALVKDFKKIKSEYDAKKAKERLDAK